MGTHPIFESDFDCLTGKMQRNSSERSSTKSRTNAMMASIPTLGDSVNFSVDKKVGKNEPPPRAIKVKNQTNLKIDFDVDIGLLMTAIPPVDAVDEEAIVWDWEQQFSQLIGDLAGHLVQRVFTTTQKVPLAPGETTPSPNRFFPKGQIKLDRFPAGFNFQFQSK